MINDKHPIQPIVTDEHGTLRFKTNKIVKFLLDNGGFDMNDLSMMDFTDNDREQFAQLIGYSVSGFGSLRYVSDETYYKAVEKMNDKLTMENSIKETVSQTFSEFIRKPLIFTPYCRSSSVDLNQEKPRTKIEYEKLDESNFNVWDLKPLLENGELYSKTSKGDYVLYSANAPTYMLMHFNEYGVYRKVDRSVEWWEDAAEFVGENACNMSAIARILADDGLYVEAKMTRDQWLDFARVLLNH